MTNFLIELHYLFSVSLQYASVWHFYFLFFPFVLVIELPLTMMIITGYLYVFFKETFLIIQQAPFYPNVTCIVACYSEGKDILITLNSLLEQLYRGNIEILIIVDGVGVNKETYDTALSFAEKHQKISNRYIRVIPKQIRGGRASSNNLGLKLANSDILLLFDGDCSFDNDLVASAVSNFKNKNVVAVSGNVRVRNAKKNLLTKLQTLEYMFGIQVARTGLGAMGTLNMVSGASGFFRKNFLNQIGGWKSGSGEDMDILIRIKAYFKRDPNLKIIHDHHAVAHTDVPENWKRLLKQRLRWDGDIAYMYFKRYWKLIRPAFLGWKNFLAIVWYDIFFCVMVPAFILINIIYLFYHYNLAFVFVILFIVYLYYLLVSSMLFLFYILFASERKLYDFSFFYILPIMPFYQFIMRTWTLFAIIFELVLSSHKDSSMAPWWVIRKTH